jgi:hypothetical protein
VIRKGQGSGNLLPSDFSAAALSHGQEEDTTLEPFVWAQKCRVTRVGGMIGGNPKEPILEGVTGSERKEPNNGRVNWHMGWEEEYNEGPSRSRPVE